MAEMNLERIQGEQKVVISLSGVKQITVPLSRLQVESREIGEVCY